MGLVGGQVGDGQADFLLVSEHRMNRQVWG